MKEALRRYKLEHRGDWRLRSMEAPINGKEGLTLHDVIAAEATDGEDDE